MRVLFLDDDAARHHAFEQQSKAHAVDFVWTASDAIAALKANEYDLACLDHDLGGHTFVASDGEEETGYTVAKAIAEMERKPRRVIVHSFNPIGAQHMVSALHAAGVPAIKAPFGTFTLSQEN